MPTLSKVNQTQCEMEPSENHNPPLTRDDIIALLSSEGPAEKQLLQRGLQTKLDNLDNCVHLRGLIEYSSRCGKNCYYCGLRRDNTKACRYSMSDDEVLACAKMAMHLHYGSIAIQCGERSDSHFVDKITDLVKRIKDLSHGSLGITLSCGEQSEATFRRWFEAGAHRYLLRIEASNRELYYKIHPHDDLHDFDRRVQCIDNLIAIGYQTGTGCMIGLPFQTVGDLADDLLFFQKKNVAMVGMGPFIPHPDTPLWDLRDQIPSSHDRIRLTMKMIATLRIMMPKINMVAATADQTLDPDGREKAIAAGANVIMPNLSPNEYRKEYLIYPDKPCVSDDAIACKNELESRLASIGHQVLYDAWGDSVAFTNSHQPL